MTNPIQNLLSLAAKFRKQGFNHCGIELEATLSACQQRGDKSLGRILSEQYGMVSSGFNWNEIPQVTRDIWEQAALTVLLSANSRPVPSVAELVDIHEKAMALGRVVDGTHTSEARIITATTAMEKVRSAILASSPPPPANQSKFKDPLIGKGVALDDEHHAMMNGPRIRRSFGVEAHPAAPLSFEEFWKNSPHWGQHGKECAEAAWTAAQSQVQGRIDAVYKEAGLECDRLRSDCARAEADRDMWQARHNETSASLEKANEELAGLRWRSPSIRPTQDDADSRGCVQVRYKGGKTEVVSIDGWDMRLDVYGWRPAALPKPQDAYSVWRKRLPAEWPEEKCRELWDGAREGGKR